MEKRKVKKHKTMLLLRKYLDGKYICDMGDGVILFDGYKLIKNLYKNTSDEYGIFEFNIFGKKGNELTKEQRLEIANQVKNAITDNGTIENIDFGQNTGLNAKG